MTHVHIARSLIREWLSSLPQAVIKTCPEAPGVVAPVILILACVSAHAILFHVNA